MSQSPNLCAHQIIGVPQSDRWRVHYRLQELLIACQCTADGCLRVEINTGLAAVQVWSVTRQFMATRQELLDWLEDCWQLPSHS
jgi:hypothetical protein